jgi:bifunctional UDP-N-acetylglucosamine pyrophosphorylase/glucosamine-1-phosphate N-acetyltransferase
MPAAAIILAAGLGTRMRSSLPKALHPIAGRPMLNHLIAACEAGFDRVVVVVGPGMEAWSAPRRPTPRRCRPSGSAPATPPSRRRRCWKASTATPAVLYADNPLISADTLRRLLARRAEAGLALLAMRPADPGRYGRVVQEPSGEVLRVVEWADADAAERGIGLCNAGVVCAPAADLLRWLRALRNDNAKGEYYLTDAVALARADGRRWWPRRRRKRNSAASTAAPSWPRRKGRRRPPCARRPWPAAPPSSRRTRCSFPGTRGSART